MFLSHFLAAVQRWRLYRTTVSELNQLSDRDLADLGISRGDIRSIARDAVAHH
jgi:uncharacterized protein YjiS (DUF1127 family)